MMIKTLFTAAAATALMSGAAMAQTEPMSSDPMTPPAASDMPATSDTSVNPPADAAPPAVIDPGTTTTEAAAASATSTGIDSSAVVSTSVVTNGPVADTPENREKYRPMSNAGRKTAARGN